MKRKLLAILASGLFVGPVTTAIANPPQPPPPILIDVLTFNGDLLLPWQSQNTGEPVTFSYEFTVNPNDDPFFENADSPIGLELGINPITFRLQYDDGYMVWGTGSFVVISHNLPASPTNTWGDHSVLTHLTVTATNQPTRKTGPWPKVGDKVFGAGEMQFTNTTGKGAYQIVRQ